MNATLRGYDTFLGQQMTVLVGLMLLSDLVAQLESDQGAAAD